MSANFFTGRIDVTRKQLLFFLPLLVAQSVMGQDLVMPDLTGQTEEQSRSQLESLGHSGKVHVTEAAINECAASGAPGGTVCAQRPSSGHRQPAMLDVFLTLRPEGVTNKISAFTLPAGITVEAARQMIVEKGFTGPIDVKPSTDPDAACRYGDWKVGQVCSAQPDGRRGRVPADIPWTLIVQSEPDKWGDMGKIPDVIGLGVTEALETLGEENFVSLKIGFYTGDECEPMTVCDLGVGLNDSGHNLDRMVRRTDEVRLVVGSQYPGNDPEGAVWPDLVGDSLRDALIKTDASGLNSSRKGEHLVDIRFEEVDDLQSKDVAVGSVAKQQAKPGWDLRRLQALTVARRSAEGSQGGKRWVRMPDLAGLASDEAKAELSALELKSVQVKERVADESCQADTVCRSSPGAGERAFLDSTQLLYVGTEPEPEREGGAATAGAADDRGESLQGSTEEDPAVDAVTEPEDGDYVGGEDIPGYEPLF